jgi:outer membrane protein W
MKNNIILGFLLSIFTVVGMNAQDKDSKHTKESHECSALCDHGPKFAPQRGDFTAQMLFGRGAFSNYGIYYVPSSNTSSISGQAPYVNDVSSNSNSVSNMAGAEFRYYTSDKFAVKLSGGAILRNTPYQVNIPAVIDTDGHTVLIPGYSSVDATEEAELQISIGGEFLLKTKNERLFPYVGFALPFDYARKSVFTPAQIDYDYNGQVGVSLPDTGARHYEVTAFSAQAIAGVDYYIAKDLFFGFEIKPVSFTYASSIKSAAPELQNLEVENSTVSFFAQYSFKLGFKF